MFSIGLVICSMDTNTSGSELTKHGEGFSDIQTYFNYFNTSLYRQWGSNAPTSNFNELSHCFFFFNFSAISYREQVHFQWDDDDEVCFAPDQHAWLDFYSARSLKQQSAYRHVATLGHIILILSQPVFLLMLHA